MKRVAMAVVLLTAWLAADRVLEQRGKELFESTSLGTNQKSCASCHPKGGRLQKAASYDDARLKEIINLCIQRMLAGSPLPPDSTDMASIISYLRTFTAP